MIVNDETISGNKKMMSVIKRIEKVIRANLNVADTFEDFSVSVGDTDMAVFSFTFTEISLESAMLIHCVMGREIPALCSIYMEYVIPAPKKRLCYSVWVDNWESALG